MLPGCAGEKGTGKADDKDHQNDRIIHGAVKQVCTFSVGGDGGCGGGPPRSQCPMPIPAGLKSIQSAMAIIIRFSVSETKPNGTLLSPPTQAHFNSRRSI